MWRIWTLVRDVMYSCRCCTLYNCRRCCHLWMAPLSPRHTLHVLHGFLQQLWDMGILVDGNWKALIPPGVKTPAAVLRSFPPEQTYGQDSAALFVSSFLCVSSGLSSLHHSYTLGFYSDYLGHSLVLVMFHQCPSCSYLFSTPCLSVPVTSHLVLSTFPILIPQRKNSIDITSPVRAESSC